MGDKSAIEWTEATWNPTYGCTKVSEACRFCYIERTPPYRINHLKFYKGSIPIQLLEARLEVPLRWKRARRIFVNSLSDLFHEDVPDWFIAKAYAVMLAAHWHTFQMLTKRPERRRALLTDTEFLGHVMVEYRALQDKGVAARAPLPPSNGDSLFANVWEGVTVENQRRADERVPVLLATPAQVRFLSCEPLLGPIDLTRLTQEEDGPADEWPTGQFFFHDALDANAPPWTKVDWVIVGGESGPQVKTPGGARRALAEHWEDYDRLATPHSSEGWSPKPSAIKTVQHLRDQCVAAGVPFLFKQWGGPTSKSGGRELDGRTWDEYPQGVVR